MTIFGFLYILFLFLYYITFYILISLNYLYYNNINFLYSTLEKAGYNISK